MPGQLVAAASAVDLSLPSAWASTSASSDGDVPASPRLHVPKNFEAVGGEMDWEDIIEDRRRREGGIGVGVKIGEEELEGDGLDLGSFLDEMDKAAGGDGVSWRESLTNRHTCAFPPVVHISALPGLPTSERSSPATGGPFQTRPKSTFNPRGRPSPRNSIHTGGGGGGGGHSRRGSQTFVVGSLAGVGGPSPISMSVRRRSLVGSLPAPPRRASLATGAPSLPGSGEATPRGTMPTLGVRRRSSIVKTMAVPGRSFSVDATTFMARRRMSSVSGPTGKLSKRQSQFQKDATPAFAIQTPLTEALALRRASAPGVMPRRPDRPASLNLFDGDKVYNPGTPQQPRKFDTGLLQETTIRARRISISAVKFDKQFQPVQPKLQAKGAGEGHLAQRDTKENWLGSPVIPVTRAGSLAVGMTRSLTAGAVVPPRSFSLSAGTAAGLHTGMGRSTSSIGAPSAPFALDAYPAFNAASLRALGGGKIDPYSFPLPPTFSKPSTPEPGHNTARRPSVVPRIPVPAYAVLAAELGLEEDRPASPSKIRAPGSGVGGGVKSRAKHVLPELPQFGVEVMGVAM